MSLIVQDPQTQYDYPELYQDVGPTIHNTKSIRDTLRPLTNKTPIKLVTSPDGVVSLTRGRWWNKQTLVYKTITDHAEYLTGLSELTLLVKTFLKDFTETESSLSDIGHERYINTLKGGHLDTLPETMYYIHQQWTHDPLLWSRFKRLFAVISLTIDPRIVDTVKWKMIQYLLQQRRVVIVDDIPDRGLVKQVIQKQDIHAVMDLMVYLPYGYLFYLYKQIQMSI